MFAPHRRHNKPKRSSDDSSPNSTDAVRLGKSHSFNHKSDGGGGGGGGLGLFSYFARARRRLVKRTHWETDSLLPTNTSSGASGGGGTPRPSAAALTCNSFLMGGHYYPGKDKKRRHMRRRTLWYKIFCSSPCRKLTSFLVVAYVLVWHILLPLGEVVLEMGGNLSARGGRPRYGYASSNNWLLYDASLKIPDLTQEQKLSVELVAARARLQYGSPQRNAQRMNLLGNIVPDWFHRNDDKNTKPSAAAKQEDAPALKPANKKEKEGAPTHPDAPKQKPSHSNKEAVVKKEVPPAKDSSQAAAAAAAAAPNTKEKVPAKKKGDESDASKNNSQPPPNSRVLQTNAVGLTPRTIHTARAEASTHSKCQTIVDTTTEEYSTTLVTQTSLSRLWILNETCARWKDPIVAVVFIPDGQELMTDQQTSSLLAACPNLQVIQYRANPEESDVQNYPVNRLRNVGLDAVTTSHVMVMDVDFVPSANLADTVRTALQQQQLGQHEHHHPEDEDQQQALVVPAFERLPPNPCESDSDCASFLQSNSSFIPKTFDTLQSCILDKDCIVFQSDNNWEGHSTTRSDQWLQRKWYEDEEEKTTFTKISCFHTARYEPYMVLRWCPASSDSSTDSNTPMAPYYDERFHGYGKNKIELVSHLRKKGYQFSILPEGFIVHNPHPESSIKEKWNDRRNSDLHASMDKLYAKFLDELDKMYKDAHDTSVKLCKREK
jgi:hypothetical protein